MKKILGLLLVVIIGFGACEGPMGPEGPPGKDGTGNWFVKDYDVSSQKWVLINDDNTGSFFEYEIAIPELSQFVFDEGAVVCYLVQTVSYNGGKPFLIQSPLPYTIYGEDANSPYSENYSYEVKPGYIKFIAKYSDFATNVQPMASTFHVVLIW